MQDIAGIRFGRLTAVKYVGDGKWQCSCACGGTATVITTNLKKGNSTSCGCKRRETNVKHGMSNSRVYGVWKSMVQRCHNPSDRSFENYGGRGIQVCEEWRDSFSQFIADMGIRPEGFDLDRIDNDKGYNPENCRWVSRLRNLNNKRTNRFLEFEGRKMTIAQWASVMGMNYRTLNNRINRGWPLERALTEGAKASFKP